MRAKTVGWPPALVIPSASRGIPLRYLEGIVGQARRLPFRKRWRPGMVALQFGPAHQMLTFLSVGRTIGQLSGRLFGGTQAFLPARQAGILPASPGFSGVKLALGTQTESLCSGITKY
jgi:hypothetical protein